MMRGTADSDSVRVSGGVMERLSDRCIERRSDGATYGHSNGATEKRSYGAKSHKAISLYIKIEKRRKRKRKIV